MKFGTPLHKHDCDACQFLGNYNGHDLYICNPTGKRDACTIIARWGSDGPEYRSGLEFGTWELTRVIPMMTPDGGTTTDYEPEVRVLRVAYLIAEDAGLLPTK